MADRTGEKAAGALAERGRRLAAVVAAARKWARAVRAGYPADIHLARARLLAAVDALDRGPGSERRGRTAPPRP